MNSPRTLFALTAALATGVLSLSAVALPASAAAATVLSSSVTSVEADATDAPRSPAQERLDQQERALGQITTQIALQAGIPASSAANAAAAAPAEAPSEETPSAETPVAEAPAAAPAAPAAPTQTAPAAPSYVSPVPGARLTAHFGAGGNLWSGSSHTGLDFAAPEGTPVKAVAAGTVASAGWDGAYGNRVVVKHTDGTSSTYSHLSGTAVRHGAKVAAGQKIGYLGSTGNSTGPHLHLEILTSSGGFTDPLSWLRGKGVSL